MIINKLNLFLKKHYNATQIEEINYVIQASLNDLSKTLILAVLFSTQGYLKEFIFAAVVVMVLRIFAGGFHLKTYIGCFLFSTSNYILIIGLWELTRQYQAIILYTAIPFAIIFIYLSPMLSKEKEQAFNFESYNKNKLILIVGLLLLFQGINKDPIYNIGSLCIIVLSIQHIIMKGVLTYEKNHQNSH